MKREAFIQTGRTETRPCPQCDTLLNGATCVTMERGDTRKMGVGDITRCAYCGTWLIVTTTSFRAATAEELSHVDPMMREAVGGITPRLHEGTHRRMAIRRLPRK